MLERLIAGVAGAALLAGGCAYERSDDDAASAATTEPPATIPDLAGELGPGGGIMSGSHELQSTPRSVYPDQTRGGTAVGPVRGLAAGLSAVRDDDRLCLELHGLPIGANLLAASCAIPAYEAHEDVEDIGRAYVSDVVIEGRATRVVWGVTYLDAATVDFGDGSPSQTPETHFPFWMHRFFALPAPPDATVLRLLDDGGRELAGLEIIEPS